MRLFNVHAKLNQTVLSASGGDNSMVLEHGAVGQMSCLMSPKRSRCSEVKERSLSPKCCGSEEQGAPSCLSTMPAKCLSPAPSQTPRLTTRGLLNNFARTGNPSKTSHKLRIDEEIEMGLREKNSEIPFPSSILVLRRPES